MSLGSIVIDLLMKTGSFETDTKRAEKRLKEFKKEAEQVGKFLGGAFATAAAAVVGVFSTLTVRSLDAIDTQAKLAVSLRTTYASLETLTRAGSLAGLSMQQIGLAGRQLEINLGRAQQGVAAQADALDALKVSAADLAKLPLDQRILKINQALRDNVDASQRAAVAADLFGAKNAAAIIQLDPATLAAAAHEVEVFGTNLSDIDAAKVEIANDAMSRFKLASKGAGDQLAVAFAPILKGIGDEFLRVAEEAGGMGNLVQSVFQGVIDTAGFVADAVDGVKRVFELLGDAIIISLNTSIGFAAKSVAVLVGALDNIPGVDLTESAAAVAAFAEQTDAVIDLAWKNINDTLEEPLPSVAFKKWAADAVESANAAAAGVVAARKGVEAVFEDEAGGGKEVKDTFTDQLIKDLEKGFAEARKYIDSTRTEIERIEGQIARVQELGRQGFFGDGVEEDVLGRLNLQLEETREKLAALEAEKTFNQFSEFADQAARNMQDAFAQFLFDPFNAGLDEMLDSFLKTIQRMLAEVLSSQILQQLFGGLAGSSNQFLSGIGSAFGGGKAAGGPVSAGTSYLVGERGPEIFTPGTSGKILPNGWGGGGTSVQVIDQRGAGAPPVDVSRQMVNGREQLRVLIRSELAGAISDGSAGRQFAAAGYNVPRGGSR